MKRKYIEKNVQPDTRNGPPARGMPEKWLYVKGCTKQLACDSHPELSRRVQAETEAKAKAEAKVKFYCHTVFLLNNYLAGTEKNAKAGIAVGFSQRNKAVIVKFGLQPHGNMMWLKPDLYSHVLNRPLKQTGIQNDNRVAVNSTTARLYTGPHGRNGPGLLTGTDFRPLGNTCEDELIFSG